MNGGSSLVPSFNQLLTQVKVQPVNVTGEARQATRALLYLPGRDRSQMVKTRVD